MQNIEVLHSLVKMPLMGLPVASPVVQLGAAKIFISPGSQLTPVQYERLTGVTDIVAPNLFHSAGVPAAARAYPSAKIWGVPGLEKLKPEIKWTHKLTAETWPYNEELLAIPVGGMPRVREIVFYHRPSKTLITTDFGFNMTDVRGLGPWLITHMFGTYNKFAISRLVTMMVKDRSEFQRSIDQIMSLDFDTILVGHGGPVKQNAKAELRRAIKERGYNA